MFRDRHAEMIDAFAQQINLVENIVGMNMPRVFALVKKLSDAVKRIDSLETRTDRLIQRGRMGSGDGEQEQSLTASQAEHAPLFTEEGPQGPAPQPAPEAPAALPEPAPPDDGHTLTEMATEH